MASLFFLLQCALLLLASACVSSRFVEHIFQVQNLVVNRLCQEQEIVTVNGQYPGPTIYAKEGDTLLIHVFNKSPYDITIHWHGVLMLFNGWADGGNYATQCPIRPGSSYTYRFNITNQEGTLWWHAHMSWLRATVHGALIIYPRDGNQYPYQKPFREIPISLGEWFNASLVETEHRYLHETEYVAFSSAFTINGQPGDFFECSSKDIYKLTVTHGRTYLLRIINVALNKEFFYVIANHTMIVVSVDASYTIPYATNFVYIAPGQTIDVLLEANQPPASYYMTTNANAVVESVAPNKNMMASGILIYEGIISSISPILPKGPVIRSSSAALNFSASIKGLTEGPFWIPVPQDVDKHMFITAEIGVIPCQGETSLCVGPYGGIIYGDMNKVSFQLPTQMSMLEAFYKNVDDVYTNDFPDEPPVKFDYTSIENTFNEDFIWIQEQATRVKKLRYNATVQIVFQNTALVMADNHPIHLHGFNFHVLAQGFGNYESARDERNFNLVNPPLRNTVDVPEKGWVVIRFRANNPGVWLMHCHLELHQSVGLGTAIVVDNGPSQSTSLPPPPLDFPKCHTKLNSTGYHQFLRVPLGNSTTI